MGIKTSYKVALLSLSFFGFLYCSKSVDYTSPDLELVTASVDTDITIKLKDSTLLGLDVKDAKGKVSYMWTKGNDVISRDTVYNFQGDTSGKHNIGVYAEDISGRYTNKTFTITVREPHIFDEDKVVVGYLQNFRDISAVKWNEITHFVYTFVFPKEDGTLNLAQMNKLADYIKAAKDNKVKILVAVGGASYEGKTDRVFTKLIKDKAKRGLLVRSIDKFVRDNELDGIDIDYEELIGGGATVNNKDTNFLLPFYKELRETLPGSTLITAAVTGGYGWAAYHFRDIAKDMSKVLDFITVMSYDNTGTWGGSNLGDPSSLVDAEGALSRYVEFDVPKSKLVLGVPFYGRDFLTNTSGLATPISYSDIIANYNPTAEEFSSGNINRGGHNIFFNSQEIIGQKASYVKDNDFRGIGIWELGNDTTTEELRLLKDILSGLK